MLVRVINLSSFFVHLITLTCYKMDNVFELELISEMGYHYHFFFGYKSLSIVLLLMLNIVLIVLHIGE
jgi:hypothetical protein